MSLVSPSWTDPGAAAAFYCHGGFHGTKVLLPRLSGTPWGWGTLFLREHHPSQHLSITLEECPCRPRQELSHLGGTQGWH